MGFIYLFIYIYIYIYIYFFFFFFFLLNTIEMKYCNFQGQNEMRAAYRKQTSFFFLFLPI